MDIPGGGGTPMWISHPALTSDGIQTHYTSKSHRVKQCASQSHCHGRFIIFLLFHEACLPWCRPYLFPTKICICRLVGVGFWKETIPHHIFFLFSRSQATHSRSFQKRSLFHLPGNASVRVCESDYLKTMTYHVLHFDRKAESKGWRHCTL